ncbi:MAG TPA: hypothetical protein VK524_23195 [Polyangiaceae bacterium]|nr:hypothetical protein [Polyangiaceae bacterium]
MARIKGTSFIEVVKVLRANRDVAATLVPAPLHGYFHDRLLPNNWYPEEEYKVLLLVVGRILAPLITSNVWEFLGEQGASRDFARTYASFVRIGDPRGSLLLSGRIWSLYRDTGRLEVLLDPENGLRTEARALLYDYELACPEIAGTITGYFRTLVRLSGGRDVRVELVKARPYKQGPSEWTLRFDAPHT